MADRGVNAFGHLVLVEIGNCPMQRRGADEGVDTRPAGGFHRLPAAVDIAHLGAREPADHGVFGLFGDRPDGGEIAFGGDREARLDDVHPHLVEHARDFQFFGMGHGGARGLLPIAQGGVEDQDAVLRRCLGSW